MIDENLLLSYGAEFEQFAPRDVIFEEGDTPKFFYQIIKGRIKLNHFDESGKELILAILEPGLSVCELLLFIDEKYPVNAVVFEEATVLTLPKKSFIQMLDDHPNVARQVTKFMAERLYHKFLMLETNSSYLADVRIRGILNYHKSFTSETSPYSYKVPLTRQQLASLTGLRVETVIRTIKNLEKRKVLKIIDRNIYY
jgi:CRP-like cAMP-binding protein